MLPPKYYAKELFTLRILFLEHLKYDTLLISIHGVCVYINQNVFICPLLGKEYWTIFLLTSVEQLYILCVRSVVIFSVIFILCQYFCSSCSRFVCNTFVSNSVAGFVGCRGVFSFIDSGL